MSAAFVRPHRAPEIEHCAVAYEGNTAPVRFLLPGRTLTFERT